MKASQRGSPLYSEDLCELCLNKDEEDISILFEILYRIIIGENFLEETRKKDIFYEVEKKFSKKAKEDKLSASVGLLPKKDKFGYFRTNVSAKVLYEIIYSMEF